MPKIIELRPIKRLRKPNFETYLSSPEAFEITEEDLGKNVLHRDSPFKQDSPIARHFFDFYNHLHAHPSDHCTDGISWFCDGDDCLWRLGDHQSLEENLYTNTLEAGTYNFSIAFPSVQIAALSYGDDKFILRYSCGENDGMIITTVKTEPGILMDARYLEEKRMLKVAMCSIVDDNGNLRTKITILTYYFYIPHHNIDCHFKLLQTQELLVNGVVDHVHIESSTNFINIFSQGRSKFIFDSLKPNYCWSQNEASLTVWLKIPETYQNILPTVEITPTKVCIELNNVTILKGDWQYHLESDDVSWSREKDILIIKLIKNEAGQVWSDLISGVTSGQYLSTEASMIDISARLSNLSINDFQNHDLPTNGFGTEEFKKHDFEKEKKYLQRFDLRNHEATHIAILDAKDCFLFTHRYEIEHIMAIKQGDDVCIWSVREWGNDYKIEHEITYPALGGIGDSNHNKKFFVSPPGWGYIALVEHSRYAFIYDKPARKKKVGKMRTVDLGEDAMPIMGAVATNEYLSILTKNKVYKVAVTL